MVWPSPARDVPSDQAMRLALGYRHEARDYSLIRGELSDRFVGRGLTSLSDQQSMLLR